MKKTLRLLLFISLIVLILSGCRNEIKNDKAVVKTDIINEILPNTDVAVVKIGVLIPLIGNSVQTGVEIKALCELFKDVINGIVDINLPFNGVEGLPNLHGAKVEFVYGDLSTPEIAMSEAERLIKEEGVIGITGSLSSAVTKTVATVTEKYDVILLSEGTSVSLLEAGYKNYGRTYPNDASFVNDTFEYLNHLNKTQNAEIANIALVCEDSEFGINIAKTLREISAKNNYKIVEDISYNAQTSNVTSEVLRLKTSNPDVVIMSAYIADSLLFVNTFKEQNYFPKMLFGQRGGFTSSDFITQLGEDANYCFTTSRWNSDFRNEVSQALMTKYKNNYSGGIDLISDVLSAGWDAYLIAIMANQAGSTNVDALRQVMYDGIIVSPAQDPTGLPGYKYGADGQNSVSSAIVLQILNSRLITVYPEQLSVSKGIYPAPAWDKR